MTPKERSDFRRYQAREIRRLAESIVRVARKFETESVPHHTQRSRMIEVSSMAQVIVTRANMAESKE
jgi:hypothetical protein